MHRQWFLHRTSLRLPGQEQEPEHRREWPGSEHRSRWYPSHQTPGPGLSHQTHWLRWPLRRIARRQPVPGPVIQKA